MVPNRSVPSSTVIPVPAYDDVAEASDWLCKAFGFRVRLRIGDHRARDEAALDAGAIFSGGESRAATVRHWVHVRLDDAKRHHDHAEKSGARILQTTDGLSLRRAAIERARRGRSSVDVISESIADVDPASWGATTIDIG